MTSWNPNLFLREGRERGYAGKYLDELIKVGRPLADARLPVVFSLAHLANLARTLYVDLHQIVGRAHWSNEYPYRNFTIKKRSGGVRWISIPAPPLMAAQDWITQNILNLVQPHDAAFAYTRERSIKRHAERHCGAAWIVKVDIEDFFGNISERQVFSVFAALGYPSLLSFEMARLCTRIGIKRPGARWRNRGFWTHHGIPDYANPFIGSLPQGAPTSPALSNLVCRQMDLEMSHLANTYAATYSRYSDDMYFSLAESTRQQALALKKDASGILHRHSFKENEKKTRIVPPGARKMVTGLVVNDAAPRIPREVRDRVRMHLYYCKTRTIPEHCKRIGFRSVIGFRNHLAGMIEYIRSIDAKWGQRLSNEFDELPWLDFDL